MEVGQGSTGGRFGSRRQTFLCVSGKPFTGLGPQEVPDGINHVAHLPCDAHGSVPLGLDSPGGLVPLVAWEMGGVKEPGCTPLRLIVTSLFIAGRLAPRGKSVEAGREQG